jgi:hypothetical protein
MLWGQMFACDLTSGQESQVASVASEASKTQAEQRFQWRFSPGDQFGVVLMETTSVKATCNTLVNLNETELTMTLSWQVTAVEDGVATLEQTIDRIQMSLKTRTDDNTNQINYDTSDRSQKFSGTQLAVAQQLQSLIGLTVKVKTKTNGAIVAVEIDEANQERMRQAPSATVVRDMMSREGMERWFRQAALVFPESEIRPGHSWEVSRPLEGVLGTRDLKQVIEWRGPETVNNRPVERFVATAQLGAAPPQSAATTANRLAGDPELPPEIKQFAETAEYDFDVELGMVVQGTAKTFLTTLGKFRELDVETEFLRTAQLQFNRKTGSDQP